MGKYFSYLCDTVMKIKSERNFMKRRTDNSGRTVVKTPLSNELPDITTTIKSGKTTYRFNAVYDGERSLPEKVLQKAKMELED